MNANNCADDENLKHDLEEYVLNNLKRAEVLDSLRKEYPEYTWSLRTLDRRLRYFDILYIDYQTDVDCYSCCPKNDVRARSIAGLQGN